MRVEANVTITNLIYKNQITNLQKNDKIVVTNYGDATAHVEIHRDVNKLLFAIKTENGINNFSKGLANAGLVDKVIWPNPNGAVTNIFSEQFLQHLIPWAIVKGHNDKDNNGHRAIYHIDEVVMTAKQL